MTGKDAPPEVKIRSYRDSPICDVVVVVHGTEMVLRCPDYRQAMRWARVERKTYKIREPDIDVAGRGIQFWLQRRYRAHESCMSYVPRAPIASPGDSQGSGEPFPCRERQPRHRKSENPDNSGS